MTLDQNNISEKFIPIVLCAGFGTRLQPLTQFIPMVVCPIIDKPLAFYNIEIFLNFGFEKVYCNTHYKSEFVEEEIKSCASYFGYDPSRIVFFNEEEILETGGGIKNIYTKLASIDIRNQKKDCIVVSGDIVSMFPVSDMIRRWSLKKDNEKAMMLSLPLLEQRNDVMWVDKNLEFVTGFGPLFAQQDYAIARLFSNHQIISHEVVFAAEFSKKSSVSLFYKNILNSDQKIIHMEFPEASYWFNVGDFREYQSCLNFFCSKNQLARTPVNKLHHFDEKINIFIDENKDSVNLNDLPPHSIAFACEKDMSCEFSFVPVRSSDNVQSNTASGCYYFATKLIDK